MYRNPCYNYQWSNPMHNNWNNNNWSYIWNPHYYNWYNNNRNTGNIKLGDHGPRPFVVNIDQASKQNNNYRTALWTGKHFQVTLMSINVRDDIGLEVHPTTDQFIRIEEGQGLVQMGDSKDKLDFQEMAYDDYAIMIPAGKWHNLTNTGNTPLKIYVIYAPPEHPYGTVHETKAIAMTAE
ncbi:cupin domain-containing protein [Cohnella sp.]|uniref:cupin domain-containing protein n=1 Tax=Cohnella sp. TaxID=1883426 RepID=UPI00356A1BD9